LKRQLTKPPKLHRNLDACLERNHRTVNIAFMSKTGEMTMSTLTPVTNGFQVTGARRVIANLLLSPVNGKATIVAKFKKAAASGVGHSMTAALTRDIGGFTSLAISSPTMANLDIDLGLFPGRQVSYNVKDGLVWRTLTFWVTTADTYGTNEVWHLDLAVAEPAPDGVTDYDIRATATTPTTAQVTSVDVTPAT